MQRAGLVVIGVYDVQGRRVRGLLEGERPEGTIRLLWDGQTDAGQPMASRNHVVLMRSSQCEATGRIFVTR